MRASANKSLQRLLPFVFLINISIMNAQNKITASQALSNQHQSIVTISALTAAGDLENLKIHLSKGLDARLTINEVKEVLVQLYAYCGFPRSLNAINTLMKVVEERRAKGIKDEIGKEATANIITDKYEYGRRVLESLTKIPQSKPAPGFGEFAPRIDTFLKEHLFADIFENDVLTYQQRELATISALSAMTGVKPQLQAHLGIGMNTGLSQDQLLGIAELVNIHLGQKQAETFRNVLQRITNAR